MREKGLDMTSTKLFINLYREHTHRSMWLILSALMLHSLSVIDFSMALRDSRLIYGDERLGPDNYMLFGITLILAILSAFQGFHFLHFEKKASFYYSLPVKKSMLFGTTYVSGTGIYLLLCITSRTICYLIQGKYDEKYLYLLFMGILINITGFLLIYTCTIFIIIIAGRIAAAFAGFIALFTYGSMVIGVLAQKYTSAFFSTFYKADTLDGLRTYLSPLKLYNEVTRTKEGLENGTWILLNEHRVFLITMICLTIIGTAVCFFLFKKRPIEGTGKIIAYPSFKPFIKFLISTPLALLTGYYFMLCSISQHSVTLLIIGILIGSFLFSGLLEILFAMDVRMAFSHFGSTICISLFCLLTAGSFYYDIWQYDRYFPAQDRVGSVAVHVEGINSPGALPEDFGNLNSELAMETMALKGETKIKVLDWLKRIYSADKANAPLTYVTTAFHRTDGTTTYRKYPIYQQDLLDQFNDIYLCPDYKSEVIPLAACDTIGIQQFYWTNGIESYRLNLDDTEKNELLACYKRDLNQLSLPDMKKENPIAKLALENRGETTGKQGYIYPSFSETIQYLEAVKVPAVQSVKNCNIQELYIKQKTKAGNYRTVRITDKNEIDKLKPNLVWSECAANPALKPVGEEVIVKYLKQNTYTFDYINCRIEE